MRGTDSCPKKRDPQAKLRFPEPGVRVGIIEAPGCPVYMFGLGLDDPIRGFSADISVILPMHIAERSSPLRILANAEACMSVALSGEGPITALGATIRPWIEGLFVTVRDAV
jgi:hypothetical protein